MQRDVDGRSSAAAAATRENSHHILYEIPFYWQNERGARTKNIRHHHLLPAHRRDVGRKLRVLVPLWLLVISTSARDNLSEVLQQKAESRVSDRCGWVLRFFFFFDIFLCTTNTRCARLSVVPRRGSTAQQQSRVASETQRTIFLYLGMYLIKYRCSSPFRKALQDSTGVVVYPVS